MRPGYQVIACCSFECSCDPRPTAVSLSQLLTGIHDHPQTAQPPFRIPRRQDIRQASPALPLDSTLQNMPADALHDWHGRGGAECTAQASDDPMR